jgi:hypothetical protein
MSKLRVLLMTVSLVAPIATIVVLAGRQSAAANATSHVHVARPTDAPHVVAQRAKSAARALMQQKSQWSKACGASQLQDVVPGDRSLHRLRVTFDPEGQVVTHHVDDLPGQSRAEVGECLRKLKLDVQIEPADAPTTVSVQVALP